MADGENPWDVRPPADQTPPVPGRPEFENIRGQWANFLDQPGARAALLQTGVALLQPPAFGDTPASQIGRAIAAGAATVGRGEEQESRIAEREARSEAAIARASAAGQGLSLKELGLRMTQERGEAGQEIRAHREFENFRRNRAQEFQKAQDAWNKNREKATDITKTKTEREAALAALGPAPTRPPELDMSFEQWRGTTGQRFGPTAPSGPPAVGEVRIGRDGKPYRFKGGDQYNKSDWELTTSPGAGGGGGE